jgi:type I restriction enzyme M protein
MANDVAILNPRTCGIYKNGAPRYKTDPQTGRRTNEIDNELIAAVDAYLAKKPSPANTRVPLGEVHLKRILVPTYYDRRYDAAIKDLLAAESLKGITIGELVDSAFMTVRGGHGSPSNDQRTGHIPYVKVSDIRGLRINVNPTNLVTESVARRFWGGKTSGLQAWDLVTPNRASSNIGEFAILLPGEERVVLTKEVFVFRVAEKGPWDPFYLLWALSLRSVRDQWRRIALMQTNREDCGNRYREIVIPQPPTREWARKSSAAFRTYFETIATAKTKFIEAVNNEQFEHIASVVSMQPVVEEVNGAAGEEAT